MPNTLTGSCHCRAVQYTITGEIKTVANCHCNTCRKTIGAAFQTIAFTEESNLDIRQGRESLAAYQVSENATKHFCRTCGTPVFNTHKMFPGHCMVVLGSLDDPSLVTPAVNVFCENMLPWVKEIAALPSFDKEPPRK